MLSRETKQNLILIILNIIYFLNCNLGGEDRGTIGQKLGYEVHNFSYSIGMMFGLSELCWNDV